MCEINYKRSTGLNHTQNSEESLCDLGQDDGLFNRTPSSRQVKKSDA
jgi:hypothetical protein